MGLFEPHLSFRTHNNTGGIDREGTLSSGASLTAFSSITFLIHGYNNTRNQATDAYANFMNVQNLEFGRVADNIMGVFWPGSNWENAFYYMQALDKAIKTAPYFAERIVEAAKSRGSLNVNIITHSLGSRFTLETIKNVMVHPDSRYVHFNAVVFMAGAVPVFLLESNARKRNLRRELVAIGKVMSIYSEDDVVLRCAFPAGELFGGDGWGAVALGRKKWALATELPKWIDQRQNPGAGHGDYWGNADHWGKLKQAGSYVRSFLPLGEMPQRDIGSRSTHAPRGDSIRRVTNVSRITEKRAI